jgi:hypothetical protein
LEDPVNNVDALFGHIWRENDVIAIVMMVALVFVMMVVVVTIVMCTIAIAITTMLIVATSICLTSRIFFQLDALVIGRWG